MTRAKFQVTEQLNDDVKMMVVVGCDEEEIAQVLNTKPATVRKHFKRELATAATEANTAVIRSLFEMATSGKNASAAIFWAKARCGWRDNSPLKDKYSGEMPDMYIVSDPGTCQRIA